MRIGYIQRVSGEKETFNYIEGTGVRRIGVRTDRVKVNFLCSPYDYEEIADNTKSLVEDDGVMLVSEPFITSDKLKERCLRWCEWANSCKNREYSFFS